MYSGNIPATRHDARSPRGDRAVLALPRRQRNFVITTFSIGLILATFNLALVAGDTTTPTILKGICLGLFVLVAFSQPIKWSRGDGFVNHRFWEYPFIVGMVLVPAYVVAASMITVMLAQSLWRAATQPESRPSIPLMWGATSAGITLGAYVATINPPWSYPVGYLCMFAVWEGARTFQDYIRGGREYAFKNATRNPWLRLATVVFVASAFTFSVHQWGDQRMFLMAVPILGIIGFWYATSQVKIREERKAWQSMEYLAEQLIGEVEDYQVILTTLTHSLDLFSASRVVIALDPTEVEDHTEWSLIAGPGEQMNVLHFPEGTDYDERPESTRHSRVMELRTADHKFGYMIIEWDPAGPDRHTRQVLANTFAHSVATSIANARHNKQVALDAHDKAMQAEIDPLTGLGNRTRLAERGPDCLADAKDGEKRCALLLFDLDGFKRINDTLGHAAGDQVLIEIARRLKVALRQDDLIIRLGGDEFAVLAVDLEGTVDAEKCARKISGALVPPVKIDGLELQVESSIGIAMQDIDGETIDELLKNADIAMYGAKADGRGGARRFSPDITFETTDSMARASELRAAIHAEELILHYQPQVDLKDGRVVGMEALVRWNHPTLGLLGPDKFVPIAERSNLVRPFTTHILKMALSDRARMREEFPDATVSVNLSAQNLIDSGLPKQIARLLRQFKVEPEELVLEVTETATSNDMIAAVAVLQELAQMKCHIAMDDFGSGYATLESLRASGSASGSPVNEIKIDRGFVKDVSTNETDKRVAGAIVEIAHAYGCRVVAEGVEDRETCDLLREVDCDVVQGYFIHRPAPLAQIIDWHQTCAEAGRSVLAPGPRAVATGTD